MWTKLYDQFINFIKQLLSDKGLVSAIRYMSIATVTTLMIVWSYLSIKNNTMMDVPWGVYAIFATAILGKVVQKGIESKDNDTIPDTKAE